jgi:hypothetical protein
MTPRSLWFSQSRVDLVSDEYLETVFFDGSVCPANFSYDEEAQKHAKDLGYGDDIRRMHIEHEVAHTFLAEAQGMPFSFVLYRVAQKHNFPVPAEERIEEEALVFSFQRYINTMSWDAPRFEKFADIPALAIQFRTRIKDLLDPS